MRWRDRKRCPHVHLRGIYGDEIIAAGYKRLACLDCGRLLNGPVLVAVLRAGEATAMDAARQRLESTDPEMGCPGCDCEPVGYAPHNGKGDCPPRLTEQESS